MIVQNFWLFQESNSGWMAAKVNDSTKFLVIPGDYALIMAKIEVYDSTKFLVIPGKIGSRRMQ